MKTWSVFGLIITFHLVVIGLLLIQPGCQSQSVDPDPGMTSVSGPAPRRAAEPVPAAAPANLDPAFNAGLSGSQAGPSRQRVLSEPTRPAAAVSRPQPDTSSMEPVLQPVLQPQRQADTLSSVRARDYTVRAGDNLTLIARREGVSLDDLMQANGLNRSSILRVGQVLQVPEGAGGVTSVEDGHSQSLTEIEVRRGDTLSKIAAENGTSVAALKSINQLTGDTIVVGQKLLLPEGATAGARQTSAPTASRPASSVPAAGGSTYVVQAGDTPSGIAKRFGVSAAALMAANNISDARRLAVGQQLVIPRSAAGAAAAQATAADRPVARPTQPSTTPAAQAVPEQPTPRTTQAQPTAAQTPPPASTQPANNQSALEALEDEDLPFVDVETVEE